MLTFIIWAIVIIGGIKLAYVLLVPRLLRRPTEADQIHPVRTADGWQIRLLRYRAKGEPGTPILFVHGLAGSPLNFAPPGGGGLARLMAERGYDCWAVDLRGNRGTAPPAGTNRYGSRFDDYIKYDLPAAIEFIRESTGHERVHWVGHSMGGLLFLGYAAWHDSSEIASAVTLGTPTEFTPRARDWHRRLRKSGALRFVSAFPAFSAWYQRMAAPILPLVRIPALCGPINWKNVDPRIGPVAYYNMLEMPPAAVLRKLSYFASENWLRVRGNRIDVPQAMADLTTPLLMIAAARDPLATPGETRAAVERVQSGNAEFLLRGKSEGTAHDYNHIDLVFSREGGREIADPIAEWFAAYPADGIAVAPRARPKRKKSPKTKPAAPPIEPEIAETKAKRPRETPAEPALELIEAESTAEEPKATTANEVTVEVASKRWSAALEDAAGILDTLGGEERKTPKKWPKKTAAKRAATAKKKTASAKAKSKKPANSTKKPAASAKKKAATKKPASKKKPATAKRKKPAAKPVKKTTAKKSKPKTASTSRKKTAAKHKSRNKK